MSDPIPGSPLHPSTPDFREHIENGVWELVDALLQRGFRTVTSCEGHPGTSGSTTRYVRIGFGLRDLPDEYNRFCNMVLNAYFYGYRFDTCFRKASIPTFPEPDNPEGKETILFTVAIMFTDLETRDADYANLVAWLNCFSAP